ncbi:uncharacterized protein V1518DRAFT_411701 [Limtongia smithiae]|uniref:uncharacterized protein n=1 Tax=Limtongia smithiae TaxID=1125753 RepID=UPI0034CEB3CE
MAANDTPSASSTPAAFLRTTPATFIPAKDVDADSVSSDASFALQSSALTISASSSISSASGPRTTDVPSTSVPLLKLTPTSASAALMSSAPLLSRPVSLDDDSNRTTTHLRLDLPAIHSMSASSPQSLATATFASSDDQIVDSLREAVSAVQTHAYPSLSFAPSVKEVQSQVHVGTPAASNMSAFATVPTNFNGINDYEFPNPKLYDLALTLNSDPGMDAFWHNLTDILENVFMAKRASLLIPNDLTDMANTPWGLKGVWTSKRLPWSLSQLQHHRGSQVADCIERETTRSVRGSDQLSDFDSADDDDDGNWIDMFDGSDADVPRSMRDSSQSLDSETDLTCDDTDAETDRPSGDVSTDDRSDFVRRISGGSTTPGDEDDHGIPFLQRGHVKVEQGVAKIYSALRPLESDIDPLIDSSGVNRVIQRGKLVLLQREYRNLDDVQASDSTPPESRTRSPLSRKQSAYSNVSESSVTTERPQLHHRNAFATRMNKFMKPPLRDPFDESSTPPFAAGDLSYEDYEQVLLSPWSNSPAPSPAVSKDNNQNPFFSSELEPTVEEAFASPDEDPGSLTPSNQEPIRAIGLESSYAVIHIPLVHPSFARGLSGNGSFGRKRRGIVPIAIVSILSDVIPYPLNLAKSLSAFAPHIAASYLLAEAHSNLVYQLDRLREHRHRGHDRLRTSHRTGRQSSAASSRRSSVLPSARGSYVGLSQLSLSEDSAAPSPAGSSDSQLQAQFGSSASTKSAYFSAPSSMKATPAGSPDDGDYSDSDLTAQLTSSMSFKYNRRGRMMNASRAVRFEPPAPKSPLSPFSSAPSPVPTQKMFKTNEFRYMLPPSPQLLRTIIDSMPLHLFIAKPKSGSITWVSARTLAYNGLTASEFCHQQPAKRMHPDDQLMFTKAWKSAMRNGDPLSLQLRLRRFDGVYRYFIVRVVPLRDSKGSIVHWFGTSVDVHDQCVAQMESIRQSEKLASERKYRTLAESSPLIVFAATRSDGIIYTNNQWVDYSGQSLTEAEGFGFLQCLHPEDRAKCELPEIIENKFSCEVRLRNAKGEYRWHLVRCVCADSKQQETFTVWPGKSSEGDRATADSDSLSPSGDPTWFGTCTDIHDHKLLEEKLEEAKDAAQRTMESKARFLSNMSHEIRTPLIGISGMVNFLLDTTLTSEQLDYCHTIRTSSEALLSVINDILDLSKAEAGKMLLHREWFNLRLLIEDATELLSTLAISKNIELNYIVEDSVPAIVNGDRIRVRQVLLNIIGNAIKFTSKGEVFLRCSVESRDVDSIMLHFECHDTGAGFDKEEEALMFKPFSQIDGTLTRRHGGSGLGLVISRQLVELHGGTISCRGEKGKGSTFYFSAKFGLPSEHDQLGLSPLMHSSSRYGLRAGGRPDATPGLSNLDKHSPFSLRPSVVSSLVPQPLSSATISPLFEQYEPGPGTPLLSPGSVATHNKTAEEFYKAVKFRDRSDMTLKLPVDIHKKQSDSTTSALQRVAAKSTKPRDIDPVFALVVCEYPFATEAIIYHIKEALSEDAIVETAHVTDYVSAVDMLKHLGSRVPSPTERQPFTHIVINVNDYTEIAALAILVFSNPKVFGKTKVIGLTTPMQKSEIMQNLRANATGMPSTMHNQGPSSPTRMFAKVSCNASVLSTSRPLSGDGVVDYSILDRELGQRFFLVSKPLKVARWTPIFNSPEVTGASSRTGSLDQQRIGSSSEPQKDQRAELNKLFGELQDAVEGHNYRVLLVEDNPVNQKVLYKFLVKGGLVVDTAMDGVECVQKVYNAHPGYYNLIICDLHMPRKDGFQTCTDLRRWEELNGVEQPCPIVALSANVMSDVAEQCAIVGFSRYVSKPIDFTVFKDVIIDLLAGPHSP